MGGEESKCSEGRVSALAIGDVFCISRYRANHEMSLFVTNTFACPSNATQNQRNSWQLYES